MQEQRLFDMEADGFDGGTLVAEPQFDLTRRRRRGGATPVRHVRVEAIADANDQVPVHPRRPFSSATKRAKDVVLATVGGLAMLPLLGLVALLVKLTSKGPVLYGHTRRGYGGRTFTCWKFRTMVCNGEEVLEEHFGKHPETRQEWEQHLKLRDDPRVTRLGRFLRKTSIDELPQLWNVLRGEMSLVGPRPIVDDEIPMYGDVYRLYAAVRPGITGLWQVSGRNNTTYPERVQFDSHYVRNWSLWLDLVILGRTVGTVVRADGAY